MCHGRLPGDWPDLLGRHIEHGSLQLAVARERGFPLRRRLIIGHAPDLGQAPIEQQDLTKRTEQNVCGLDVSMHDTVVVGVIERVTYLDQHVDLAFQAVREPVVDLGVPVQGLA